MASSKMVEARNLEYGHVVEGAIVIVVEEAYIHSAAAPELDEPHAVLVRTGIGVEGKLEIKYANHVYSVWEGVEVLHAEPLLCDCPESVRATIGPIHIGCGRPVPKDQED